MNKGSANFSTHYNNKVRIWYHAIYTWWFICKTKKYAL